MEWKLHDRITLIFFDISQLNFAETARGSQGLNKRLQTLTGGGGELCVFHLQSC